MAEHQALDLEAEADDWIDGDSGIGDSIASSTASIGSSIMKYREENGRTYHAYKDGQYFLPNDERENDRLDLQHHLTCLTFGGKLFQAPIPREQTLHRVLDVGTGTGIWAIDFADEHPESQVLGIDLSPIQPDFVPPNLAFQIDDLEESWTFNEKFDFIYSRNMVGSFKDFGRFFKKSYENLSPGGWIEVTDPIFPPQADDGSLSPDSALMKWSNLVLEAGAQIGQHADAPKHYRKQLESAGFVNIQRKEFIWPQNRWPKDKHLKELGMWQMENYCGGLTGLSMALSTRVVGMSKEEVEAFLVDVRKDMRDTKIHAYWPVHVYYAQKPK